MGEHVDVVSEASGTDVPRRRLARRHWVIVALFGLVFAYQFWTGLSRVIDVQAAISGMGSQLNALGWFLLIAGAFVPFLAFALGLAVSRASTSGRRALILFVALCVSAAMLINICFTIGFGSIIA